MFTIGQVMENGGLQLIKDSYNLVKEVCNSKDEVVSIEINLPNYLDVTSLLILQRRIADVRRISKKKLRLVGRTNNLDVEKMIQKVFIEYDDIYVTVIVDG